MLSLLSQSQILCTYIVALTEWSLILQCEKYLKFHFTFYKVSGGKRDAVFNIISVPFEWNILNVVTMISFIWNPLLWSSSAIHFSTFSSSFSSLFFIELSSLSLSQYIRVRWQWNSPAHHRMLLLTIIISVLSWSLKDRTCYSPTMSCCLFNCLYYCSWDLVKIMLNDCCLDSFILKPCTHRLLTHLVCHLTSVFLLFH